MSSNVIMLACDSGLVALLDISLCEKNEICELHISSTNTILRHVENFNRFNPCLG